MVSTPFELRNTGNELWNLDIDQQGNLLFNANNSSGGDTRMFINDNTGDIGIGTNLPQAKLHIIAGTTNGLKVNVNNQNVWAIQIRNSQNNVFQTGMRVTNDGFFEITNIVGWFY